MCTPGADGDAARGTEAGGRVLSGGVPEALAEAVLLSYGDGAGSAVLPEEGLEPGEGRMSGLVNRSPHEATLIARAARGEAEAFSALVREHSTLVYRIALRMLGANEAPDASQEVWLRVWRSIENFKGESAFTTWLSKIAVNTCLSSREKEARRRDRELPEEFPHLAAPTGGENDPESAALDDERRKEIGEALLEIRAEHRAAVVLRHLEGLSYEEIAGILDVPRGTAKGWASRGRAALLVALAARKEEGRSV